MKKQQQVIRCCSCGSSDIVNNGKGIGVCNHCGSNIILPRQDEEIVSMLNSAYVYRENFNYDLAIKSYQFVLEKDSNELSAYEGLLLAEYGIEYVKDSYTGKLVPTCHRAHFKSILQDTNYQTLIALASDEQKAVIEQKAKEIDKLQKAIEKQLKNEESYDIFISYKAQNKNGEKTEDALIARQIYEELSAKNYKVFLAEKSLEDRLGSEYEPIIFKALHTCKIFILVGTSKENIEANWVRNEWSRFVDRVKTDKDLQTGCFIPVFKGMNPYDMPKVNNTYLQGVDASKIGYLVTLVDGVTKLLKPQKEQKVLQAFDDVDNFAEFERIRKQRTLDVKKARWKDLQTNPHRKTEKWLYNTFLLLPYVFFAVLIGLMSSPVCWFITSAGFICMVVFAVLLLATSITIACVHPKRYPTSAIFNIVIPFASFAIIIASYIFCVVFYPLANDGRTAANLYALDGFAGIHNGLVVEFYSQQRSGTIEKYAVIRGSTSKSWYKQYIEEKDGKTWLIMPDTINGYSVREVSGLVFANMLDEVEVLVAPKHSTYFSIGGSQGWNNKYFYLNNIETIYVYNTLSLELYTYQDMSQNLIIKYSVARPGTNIHFNNNVNNGTTASTVLPEQNFVQETYQGYLN